jgi:hypothetical protein
VVDPTGLHMHNAIFASVAAGRLDRNVAEGFRSKST